MKLSVIVLVHFPMEGLLGSEMIFTTTLSDLDSNTWEPALRRWMLEQFGEEIERKKFQIISVSHCFIPEG